MTQQGQDNAHVSAFRQLELLRQLQRLEPSPFLMGGVAEDALLYGRSSRPHGDLDLMVERSDLDRLLDQLRSFGYESWTTKGENAAGEPFYLAKVDAAIPLELAVTDRNIRGEVFAEIARVDFKLATGDAPVGYRVYLPPDTYEHAPAPYEGIPVRCISPLANYQLRMGIGSRGTFGPMRPSDKAASEQLRAKFFPEVDEAELFPRVEAL